MRTMFRTTEGDGMFVQVAAIAIPPALIVVEDNEAAVRMEGLVHAFGQTPMKDLLELHPLMSLAEAQRKSVEIRTLTEMEQMDANEKLAMEVL